MLKRGVDIGLSAAALIALSPLLAAAALAVRFTTGTPVLFRDQRAGRDGVPFEMLKFRTMRDLGPGETIPEHDQIRITRIGGLLRRTSIDELPSLLNIARGDMSFVGPRPLPTRYVERYDVQQRRRLEVRPGLTGMAQSAGRNTISWEDRFELDVRYVDEQSFRLDMAIIWRTLRPVLSQSDTDTADGGAMPEFLGSEEPD